MIGNQTFYADQAPAEMAVLADGLESAPLTEAMTKCAVVMKQSVRDNFTSSASPDGSDWPPRKHIGDGHPLLIDTGAMLQAATGGGAGAIEIIQDREVAVGVDGRIIPYASIHNFGAGSMPQREFAGLRPEHEDVCNEIVADGIMQEVFG